MQKNLLILALGASLSLWSATDSFSDELKLKTGETLTGRITYEAADIIKIEVAVTASIKETKIISRADIAEIVKDAPDVVEFNRLQKLVPTGSLVPAGTYRQLLETGPDAFLKAYPDSTLAPKVKEIRDTLAGELDKVERGYIKLENDWISPQEKIDFKELVESRVRFLSMDSLAKAGNFNGQIAAMKEFEILEENYLGSPAFPRAVELALQVIPALGRQLQIMARDVDYRNAEYDRALQASAPEAREQLLAVKARDEKAFQDRVAAEKKEGVKWISLNPAMKTSIEEYLKLASAELARVREYDLSLLRAQAEQLVEADKLIAENKIGEARTKLASAAAMTGQKTESKTATKSKSKSKSKGPSAPGSYLAALEAKVNERLAEEQIKNKAKAAAEKSEALAANLKSGSGEKDPSETTSETAPAADPAKGEPEKEEVKKADQPPVDEFAALAASKKQPQTDAKEKAGSAKKPKATKKETPADDGDTPPPPVIEEEGGFPKWLIAPIITVLLLIVIVVLKVLGIGGKKTEE